MDNHAIASKANGVWKKVKSNKGLRILLCIANLSFMYYHGFWLIRMWKWVMTNELSPPFPNCTNVLLLARVYRRNSKFGIPTKLKHYTYILKKTLKHLVTT